MPTSGGSDIHGMTAVVFQLAGAAVFGWASVLTAASLGTIKEGLQVVVLLLSAAVSISALYTFWQNKKLRK
jgi:hypothetical protein